MAHSDLNELEMKLSYLERHVEEQDRVILKLSQEFDKAKRSIAKLEQSHQAQNEGSPEINPIQERPPHY